MTEPTTPSATTNADDGFLAPDPAGKPAGRCFRCGKPTHPGVGLCDEHNPSKINAPGSTQMHATILMGIIAGVLVFFFVARLAVGTTGPYGVEVDAVSLDPSGGVALAFAVTNEGRADGVADCRVTRDGVVRPDDYAFRTPSVPGNASITVEQLTPAPPEGTIGYQPDKLTVVCD